MRHPPHRRDSLTRRQFSTLALGFAGGAAFAASNGCSRSSPPGKPDAVWGRHGYSDGRFHRPRAITIDSQDRLYIVDLTARIQVFDGDGQFIRAWQTPISAQGRPTGLSIDSQGRVVVADTHYFRVLFYTPEGEWLEDQTIGGTFGGGPGEFCFVTDVAEDSQGNLYISEYGEYDRIQKFSPDHHFIMQWGHHGSEPGQFLRPQNLAIDENDHLWVSDACNDRIQVFDVRGADAKLVQTWGQSGTEPGQLRYPYGMWLASDSVYLCEFGNHRVQKFSRDGKFVAAWGEPGHKPGQLQQPWGVVRDSRQRLYVLDTYNHRVQRILL